MARRWVHYNASISFVCEEDEDDEVEHKVLGEALKAATIALKGRSPGVGAYGPARSEELTESHNG